jgi:uncharacterized membrane protein
MSTLVVIGYDDEFKKVTPDKVLEELQGSSGKVLKTSLSHDDEARLQAALNAATK